MFRETEFYRQIVLLAVKAGILCGPFIGLKLFDGMIWLNGNYLVGWTFSSIGINDWGWYIWSGVTVLYLALPPCPAIHRRSSCYLAVLGLTMGVNALVYFGSNFQTGWGFAAWIGVIALDIIAFALRKKFCTTSLGQKRPVNQNQ